MARESLRSVLGKRFLISDGAMGTELMARGLRPGECGELWNMERAQDVRAIHDAYASAGCDLITTNTFGGNRHTISAHGLGDHVRDVNIAGAQVARAAAGERAWVLGDIGPFGDFLEPAGDVTPAQLYALFLEQVEGLKEGGADGIIIETMSDPAELALAVKAAKSVSDWPVIATYSFSAGTDGRFRTMMGTRVEKALKEAIDAGATVVGANCGTLMTLPNYAALAEELMLMAGTTPVILQPNAGSPTSTQWGVRYPATGEEMANLTKLLQSCGVKVVGGCCGTTPGHLAAMARAVET